MNILDRVKEGKIDYRQAQSEIAGHKHIIQCVALDWMYNKRRSEIESQSKESQEVEQIA